MPYTEEMTWDADRKVWRRFFDGKRFQVSARQLGLGKDEQTRDASRELANKWWRTTEHSLSPEGQLNANQRALLEELKRRQDFAKRFDPTKLPELAEREACIKNNPNATLLDLEGIHEGRLLEQQTKLGIGSHFPDVKNAPQVEAFAEVFTDRKEWKEKVKHTTTTDKGKSIGKLVEKYLASKLTTEGNGLQKIATTRYQGISLNRFAQFVGADTSIDSIGFDFWHSWGEHCQAHKGISAWTAHGAMTHSKAFVKWLFNSDRIERLPKNFDEYGVKQRTVTPKTFTPEEVKLLLSACSRNYGMRAIFLLALNTGMYQVDIADIKRSELDLNKGTITRKRVKTQDASEDVPTVTYVLWKETIEELKKVMSKKGEYLLLTSAGTQWVSTQRMPNGSFKRTDNIFSAFNRLCARLKLKGKSFKMFRTTSASNIGNHKEYRPFIKLFLGHAPKDPAEKFYLQENSHVLGEAIQWLRTQYEI